MTNPSPETWASPRSTFVTVLAWIFIVLSAFTTLISVLQNIMMASFPAAEFSHALEDTTAAAVMPSGARFFFANFRTVLMAMLVVCVLTLIASIGLLQRRNWARLTFIGLLALGIAYMIGTLFLQRSMMSSFTTFPQDSTFQGSQADFSAMLRTMQIFMIVFSLGIAAVFGWIIVRLRSPRIRAEFEQPGRAA